MGDARVFVIQMEPRGASRPRVTRRGTTYYPEAHRTWAARAIEELSSQMEGEPIAGPLEVDLILTFKRPSSRPAWLDVDTWRARLPFPHAVKPDADNVAKLVLDCMTSAGVIVDDARVARLYLSKKVAGRDDFVGVRIIVRSAWKLSAGEGLRVPAP